MNLDRSEALEMQVKTLRNTEYLFIEAGCFNARNGNQWKSPWFVIKRP